MTKEVRRSQPTYESCPKCKEAFEKISLHWQRSEWCDHPNYNPIQKATTTGMLFYKGYLTRTPDTGNNALVCFFNSEEIVENIFNLYDKFTLKTMYMNGVEFFGRSIRRKHVLFLKSHPYLSSRAHDWGTGRNKSVPHRSDIGDVSVTTFKFLYSVVGDRGYDGNDWATFDCTKCDVPPNRLRGILERYRPFVSKPDNDLVVLRDSEKFFEDLTMATTEFG